jgi:predicted acyl esterase
MKRFGVLFVAALITGGYGWASDLPVETYTEWSTEKDNFVSMRDGIHLDTGVSLPTDAPGKLPTALVRMPYDKDTLENQVTLGWTNFFLKYGYAVVVQNERGRFFSEGT